MKRLPKHLNTFYLLGVVILGLTISWVAYQAAHHRQHLRLDRELDALAVNVVQATQRTVDAYAHQLQALSTLFAFADNTEWSVFSKAARRSRMGRAPFDSLEWAPQLHAAEVELLSDDLQAMGLPRLTVNNGAGPNRLTPKLDDNGAVQPVAYVFPFESNRRVYGFNILSGLNEPLVRSSRESNRLTISRLTALIGPENRWGFAIYQPVYRNHTIDQPFLGHVIGIAELGAFMRSIVAEIPVENASVMVVDRTAGGAEGPLVMTDNQRRVLTEGLPQPAGFRNEFTRSHTLKVLEREWELLIKPSDDWVHTHHNHWSFWVLGGGIILTLAGAVVTWQRNRHIDEIERQVNERTAIMERMRSEKEGLIFNSPHPIFIKSLDFTYLSVNPPCAALYDRKVEEIIGRRDADIFPPEMVSHFQERDREVIARGSSLQYEETMVHGGVRHHFIVTKFPLRNAAGEIYAIGGLATERGRTLDIPPTPPGKFPAQRVE